MNDFALENTGTEFFDDVNSEELVSISGESECSYRAGSTTSWGSPRRVAFVDSSGDAIHEREHQPPVPSQKRVPSTDHSHKMILVNRKTDMMPFTDLDPMMFY